MTKLRHHCMLEIKIELGMQLYLPTISILYLPPKTLSLHENAVVSTSEKIG